MCRTGRCPIARGEARRWPAPASRAAFGLATGLVLLVAGTGCNRTAPPATDPSAWSPADIEKILAGGGKHWSSSARSTIKERSFGAGERFWIWPEKDEPVVITTEDDPALQKPRDRLTLSFHWRLRPGQPPPGPGKQDPLVAQLLLFDVEHGPLVTHWFPLRLPEGETQGLYRIEGKQLMHNLRPGSSGARLLMFISNPGGGEEALHELFSHMSTLSWPKYGQIHSNLLFLNAEATNR